MQGSSSESTKLLSTFFVPRSEKTVDVTDVQLELQEPPDQKSPSLDPKDVKAQAAKIYNQQIKQGKFDTQAFEQLKQTLKAVP